METRVYHPVDHGWAWFVCFGTGVQAFFVVGGLKSMGVLFMTLVEMFEAPPSLAAVTLGLVAAGFAIFALLSNAFAMVIGYRKVLLCGTVLCALSGFLSMWAMNIYYIIVSLGLLSGLAFGAMATPSIVLLNFYFDKRKSFANGLAMVGSSIGQLCLPYVMTYFIDEFGYRGAMLLYTGVCLQAIPAAMLLRPLDFWIPKSILDKAASHENDHMKSSDGNLNESKSSLFAKKKTEAEDRLTPAIHRSMSSLRGASPLLYGSQRSVGKDSTLAESTGSMMLGLSIENLATQSQQEVASTGNKNRTKKSSQFCKVLFDRDLLTSITFWMLFCSLGIGHAGFIDACLYLPSLGYELFNSKYKGALLIAIMGFCDIGGRIGGGIIADLGFMRRTHLTGVALSVTGTATFLTMFYPVFPLLVFYSVVMGLIGGIYRILMPVLVRDLFGVEKLSAGVGLCYLSLGTFILPMPTLLGYMKQVYGSYLPAMMLCGVLLMFSALLMFMMPFYQQCDRKRSKEFIIRQEPKTDGDPENISFTMVAENRESNSHGADAENAYHSGNPATEMTEKDIKNVKL